MFDGRPARRAFAVVQPRKRQGPGQESCAAWLCQEGPDFSDVV